jgi:serine protease DegQ
VFGEIPRIVRRVQPSVVAVERPGGEGSGVIYDSDGLVVTNNHVVAGADAVTVVLATGKEVPAEVVATDPLTDLAVLRVALGGLPAAEFATEVPPVGSLAVAVGNPLGFENTVTAGIVSGLQRSIPGPLAQTAALVDLVQTDAAISPGNSGGALVGADGRVIGINVAYVPPNAGAVSLGFAIPAPTVLDVVDQLVTTGRANHPFLGIQPTSLTPELARRFSLGVDEGVLVVAVVPDAPAADAGVAPGDVVVSLGGEPVRSLGEFLTRLRDLDPGDTVTIGVVRNGKRQDIRVTLSSRRDER